jgi:L-ascorbate metabolism protein UlaG (beta-lactamase superfamily)
VELRYYGHSMFSLTSDGTTVVIDPFNDDIGHPRPDVAPDAIVVSHEHFDHNNVALCGGSPKVIRGLADEGARHAAVDVRVGPIRITGVPCYHDDQQGGARGKNTITIYEVEGLRIVHLGDLGHLLTDEQVRAIGRADVLMVPVGGHYTIGPAEAARVIDQLTPRVIIPMHFKTEVNASWPIGTLEEFLKGRAGARRVGTTIALSAAGLPAQPEVWAPV